MVNTGETLRSVVFVLLGGLSLMSLNTTAADTALPDCPLRDAPFSVDLPLMDILLSDQASAVANRHMGGVLDQLPTHFASREAPSFSAIITLKTVVSMAGMDEGVLKAVDAELAQLDVTDADRAVRCARYDQEVPDIAVPEGKPRILVFEKMTGFRDGPSVEAAAVALEEMADRNGWAMVTTDKGGAMTSQILEQFDVVIWNNISGDVLTLAQRQAFRAYIESGGGYVGIHGSGGDPNYFWDWYADELLGARFIGHSADPQFQDAKLVLEETDTGIGDGLPTTWVLNDEWYSFRPNPRNTGSTVIATLDESTFSTVGRGGQDLSMERDHAIAWTRCVGMGRSFYSAIGHRPEMYRHPHHLRLLEQGIAWAAGSGERACNLKQHSFMGSTE